MHFNIEKIVSWLPENPTDNDNSFEVQMNYFVALEVETLNNLQHV